MDTSVRIILDGANYDLEYNEETGEYETVIPKPDPSDTDLKDGYYNVYLRTIAEDIVSGQVDQYTRVYNIPVEEKPLILNIFSPMQNGIYETYNISFSGSIENGSEVTLELDGEPVEDNIVITDSNTFRVDRVLETDGKHIAKFTATNASKSQTVVKEVNYTIDIIKPEIESVNVLPNPNGDGTYIVSVKMKNAQ